MKRFFSILLAVAVCCAASTASANTLVTASGTGSVCVPADTAVITLGVSTRGTDVLEAQADVNAAIAAIRQALEGAGVAGDDINTDCISVYPVYDYSGDQEALAGYSVSSSLAVRTGDMDRVGTLIDLAFAAGANTLTGITFSAGDTSEAESEALALAVGQARAHGEALCAAAGLTITGIRSLEETGISGYNSGADSFPRVANAEAASAETVVQAAQLTVTVTVSMVFEAE